MRDAPRLHVGGRIEAGQHLRLDETRRHYLVHVMRAVPGDTVRVFNAESGEWEGRIAAGGGRREAVVLVGRRVRAPLPAPGGPVLLFAPLKRDATDLAVRMATELGAVAVHPVLTERTIASRVNEERLALIAREAAEQCERLDVPAISPPAPLAAVLDAWTDGPIAAALERARRPARRLGLPGDARPASALLVGPEGGFAPRELDVILAHAFIQPVSLGPLVLRAETAVAAGLALLRAEQDQASGSRVVSLDIDVEPG